MGSNPSWFPKKAGGLFGLIFKDEPDNSLYPVDDVSWQDCQEFIRKLNKSGEVKFRLPTEAEWEYAARSGGQKEKYPGGYKVGQVGWYGGNSWFGGNSKRRTHPVGQKKANGLGIYDMSGNVWEWVQDKYKEYSAQEQRNPINNSGTHRVVRGGSWRSESRTLTCTSRWQSVPGEPGALDGGCVAFRLVMQV